VIFTKVFCFIILQYYSTLAFEGRIGLFSPKRLPRMGKIVALSAKHMINNGLAAFRQLMFCNQ
jgi:hypothetical protein